MRSLVLRLSRILLVALLASAVIAWAKARGLGWLGWSIAVGLFFAMVGLRFLRLPRAGGRREERWEGALFSAARRPGAIKQVKRAIARLEPVRQQTRGEHTRLCILLAELLDAQGDYGAATAVVDAVPLDALPALDAGLVRHTRAVTHLRASDPEGALEALRGHVPSGDVELEQRLSLLEAYAKLELGDAPQALALAADLEGLRGIDESVVIEARVVRAAALDALGRREEAMVALAALGRESLGPLSELGQPRVRALVKSVMASSEA